MGIIYFLVAIVATTIGAIAGLGGGVIIKPVLDTLGQYNMSTISILSSFTVFSMALVSTIKQFRAGFEFKINTIIISLGAISGGLLGEFFFNQFKSLLPENTAKGIQSTMLCLLLILIILSSKFHKLNIKSKVFSFFLGIIMGSISTFLGIGGGPVNVALMTIFLGMTIKEAAVNSILTILLAQASQLISISFSRGFSSYDLTMLWFMIPASILGGIIGSKLNKQFNEKTINYVFNSILILLSLLNFYNAFGFLT